MKGKSSRLKQIISMVSSKTDAMKARFMVTAFTLLSKKNNFSISAISAKISGAVDGMFRHRTDDDEDDHLSKAIVLHSNKMAAAGPSCCKGDCGGAGTIYQFDGGDDDKYPDLRHSLFDEEEEEELAELLDDPNSSVSAIDMVKNSKEVGESFNLEDEIDEVADLFITKFHKRMRLQKLLSFKRNQQMLDRSN